MQSGKRPVFGNRHLTDDSKVFQHNAWDNVEWTEDQENQAHKITSDQTENAMTEESQQKYLENAASFWDKFYEKHDNKFFKDRHWLFTEFPELIATDKKTLSPDDSEIELQKQTYEKTKKENESEDTVLFPVKCDHESPNKLLQADLPGSNSSLRYMEIGCGAGNTIFPVLNVTQDPNLFLYACDYSQTAVDLVKSHKNYDTSRCYAFVHDISSTDQQFPMPEESLDIVIMIFVLSALEFKNMHSAIQRIVKLLKPGGMILFRDYGRYDMAQLRFKSGRCLSQNFYTRGDGTLVYFFTQEEVRDVFTAAGLVEKQNIVDRRLQVNRARQIKMYRVWVQAKYQKPTL